MSRFQFIIHFHPPFTFLRSSEGWRLQEGRSSHLSAPNSIQQEGRHFAEHVFVHTKHSQKAGPFSVERTENGPAFPQSSRAQPCSQEKCHPSSTSCRLKGAHRGSFSACGLPPRSGLLLLGVGGCCRCCFATHPLGPEWSNHFQ